MTREEKARLEIDAQRARCGWVVQTKDRINLATALGVTVGEISQGILRDTVLPVLPLAKPTRIVVDVERRLSVMEELEAVVSANSQQDTCLRQSILQKAFTGNLKS